MLPRVATPRCQAGRAVLQIRNGTMQFVPGEGTWVIEGEAGADGGLLGIRSTTGTDRKSFDTRFDGVWSSTRTTGVYRTPGCVYDFDGTLS